MRISILLLTILIGLSCNNPPLKSAEKPNILFLFADDFTFRAVQSLGNSEIQTPNIDRLVKRGTTFTHAYNMGGWHGAICAASRTMLMSGQKLWPAWDVHQSYVNKDSSIMRQTWGRIMARNGYNTYMSGKWHVAAAADYVFDQARHIRPGMPKDNWGQLRKNLNGRKLTEMNSLDSDVSLKDVMPVGYHRPNNENDKSWTPSDTSFGGFWAGGKHWSEVLKDDGLDYLVDAAKKEEPFFMYLAFNAPHDPRQAPQEFVDMYPLENISTPPNYQPLYPWKDSIGNSPGLRDEALAPFPRTEYAVKVHISEYYAIISHLDQQIGEILDALEASGKMDNTYIFFSADHGLSVGQHGLIGKQSMFDHSMRVPLIVAGPGIPEGQKVDHDIYLQDIMPTTLELAGIKKPDYVDFKSFLSQAKGRTTKGNYEAIYGAYIDLQRMIRKDGYKLIVYPRVKKVILYDMKNDPWETTDLAGEGEHQERVKGLFASLIQLQGEMEDKLDLSPLYQELFP